MTIHVFKPILAALFGLGFSLYAAAASADVDYDSADTGSLVTTDKNIVYAGNDPFNGPE